MGVQVSVLVLVLLNFWCKAAEAEPQVPCYFIFGDSLVDNGNNNQLQSLARANYMPYGVDFPEGPTGRFSNGKTTVDVVGKLSYQIQFSLKLTKFFDLDIQFKIFTFVVISC